MSNFNPWAGRQPRGQDRHISPKRKSQRLVAELVGGVLGTDLSKQEARIQQDRLARGNDIIARIKSDPNDREAHTDLKDLQKEMQVTVHDRAMAEYGTMNEVESQSVAEELTGQMGSALGIIKDAGSEVQAAKDEFAREMPPGLSPTQESYVLSKVAEASLDERNIHDAGFVAVGVVNPRVASDFVAEQPGDSHETRRFKVDLESRMMSNEVRTNPDQTNYKLAHDGTIVGMDGQQADDILRNDNLRNTASGLQVFDHREGQEPDSEMSAEEADLELSRLAKNPAGSGRSGVEPYGVTARRKFETGTD